MQSVGFAANVWCTLLIPVNSKGRYTEFDPRFHSMNGFAKLLYKHIDIVATPVLNATEATSIEAKLFQIRNALSRSRIRIEVIVDMQTVHIVSLQNIRYDVANVIPVFRNTWIKDFKPIVVKNPFRMLNCNVV